MFFTQNIPAVSLQPESTLTDGQLTCSWQDVIDIFEDLSIFLEKLSLSISIENLKKISVV